MEEKKITNKDLYEKQLTTLTNYDESILIDEKIEFIARRILRQHKYAFEELAK